MELVPTRLSLPTRSFDSVPHKQSALLWVGLLKGSQSALPTKLPRIHHLAHHFHIMRMGSSCKCADKPGPDWCLLHTPGVLGCATHANLIGRPIKAVLDFPLGAGTSG